MKKFKKGDIVELLESSQFFSQNFDECNPPAVFGLVVEVENRLFLPIRVLWMNGKRNRYDCYDLELVCDDEKHDLENITQIIRMIHGM